MTAISTQPLADPAPGIYPNIPAEVYHRRWRGGSASALSLLARSPAHLRWSVNHPEPPTDEMKLGLAFHALILEPDEFARQYVGVADCTAPKKDGVICGNAAKFVVGGEGRCGVHAKASDDPRIVLGEEQWTTIHLMRDAVLAHPAASGIVAGAIHRELSFRWRGPRGVWRKGRADMISRVGNMTVAVDFKTTINADPRAFINSIYQYRYDRQACHYETGLAECGLPVDAFVFIPVEKEGPYGVSVVQLAQSDVDNARVEVERLLAIYDECELSGVWPAYSGKVVEASFPSWAVKKIEEGSA